MTVGPERSLSKGFFFLSFSLYLAAFIGLFQDVVFYGSTFAKRDIWRFYYPVWHFGVESVKNGVLPLWNPYNSYGAPFLADIQTCVFYPLAAILYLPDYLWAFNFYILVHLALSGAFCAVWMRDCAASKEAALLSGLAYCLGGYVMSAISLTISLASLVYFPLALLTLRRAFNTDGFFWKGMAALALLVQYLAGDPAIFFATWVVLTLATLFKTWEGSSRPRRIPFKYGMDFVKVILLFLGLSSFQWPLFFEFLMRSNRAGMGYDEVTMWSLQYNDLVSLFFPYFSDISMAFMDYWTRQSWLENAYAGIVVLILAIAALGGGGTRTARFHAFLALFGIALCLGRFSPVYNALYHGFPFFHFIRYPARFLFLTSFALACLSGFGLDALLDRTGRRTEEGARAARAHFLAWTVFLLVVLVILTMVFSHQLQTSAVRISGKLLGRWAGREFEPEVVTDLVVSTLSNIRRTTLLVGLSLAGVLAALRGWARRKVLAIFFMLLVSADLALTNVIEIRINRAFLGKSGKNLARVLEDKGLYRVIASPESVKLQYQPSGEETLELMMHGFTETLTPNLLLPYRVGDVSGYDSIFVQESTRVNKARRNAQNSLTRRFYDMLNIKYMVSPNKVIEGPYRLIQESHPVNLFLNERALPRAFLVPTAEVVTDRESILEKITAEDFDPQSRIFLEEDPGPGEVETGAPARGRVDVSRYEPNRVQMRVLSEKPQWLFLSDMHYPGWKAWVDGRPLRIFRANYAFRAVRVGQGVFNVEWKYDPILFKIGAGVSLCTFLGLLLGFWRGRRRMVL